MVVLDTAPTGHTILLLDAAESYHREVLRQGSRMPESVRRAQCRAPERLGIEDLEAPRPEAVQHAGPNR